jgi:hypothetical protein
MRLGAHSQRLALLDAGVVRLPPLQMPDEEDPKQRQRRERQEPYDELRHPRFIGRSQAVTKTMRTAEEPAC